MYVYVYVCMLCIGDIFLPLAIVNSAAMNIGVQVSESLLSVLLGIYLEVELMKYVAILCLTS